MENMLVESLWKQPEPKPPPEPEPDKPADTVPAVDRWETVQAPDLEDLDALELVRRVDASDAGLDTIHALESGVDRLCRSYTNTPASKLLVPLRAYRSYILRLLDGRVSLAQRSELLRLAGWLSLLTATCEIDIGHHRAAGSNLDAARIIANEIGHDSLAAWVFETEAWQALTDGRYDRSVKFSDYGLELAPPDSSAHVQLHMQKARASARIGLVSETHAALDACSAALDRMPTPEHPEHHYVFDPQRLIAYSAAAFVWLGDDDGAAEEYARRAVAQYADASDGRWVRRLALARIDLAVVLARADQPEEAAQLGKLALDSDRLATSDLYHVESLYQTLTARYPELAEAAEFRDRFVEARPSLAPAGEG
jgi:tetratricopeptide (TPR) repeat protein